MYPMQYCIQGSLSGTMSGSATFITTPTFITSRSETSTVSEATQLTRRRVETRQKLLDAAVPVFAERGILGASVEEICERAEFTRGAFYSNFSSRDDLVLALLQREADDQIRLAQQAIGSIMTDLDDFTTDTDDLVGGAIRIFAQSQPTDRTRILVQRELRLYAVRNPEITEEFLDFQRRCEAELSHVIEDALRALRRELTLPVETALAMLTALYEEGMFRSLLQPPAAGSEAMSFQLLEDFLRSITRPIGDVED